MALSFGKYTFYHIPKTGGNYTREIIKALRVPTIEIGHNHSSPLDNPLHDPKLSFTIVRHPFTWYESYYRYRFVTNWRNGHYIDQHAKSDSFEGFVGKMLRAYPCGYVTARYLSNVPFCKHVLRIENLTKQLIALLKSWDYVFPMNIPRTNVTPKVIDTSISDALKMKLLKSERRIITLLKY